MHLVLISLSTQFSQFKVSYNCQKEALSLNELISHCVQEEERLKQEKIESVHLTGTSKDIGKKRKKDKEAAEVPCDAPKPGCPLTTRQPAEYSWMSGNPTPFTKSGRVSFVRGALPKVHNLS